MLSESLVVIGQSVSFKELVTNILYGLGLEYHTIATVLLNVGTLLDFDDLKVRLLTYESQLAHSAIVSSTPMAFYQSQLFVPSCSTQQWNKNRNEKKKWNKVKKDP